MLPSQLRVTLATGAVAAGVPLPVGFLREILIISRKTPF